VALQDSFMIRIFRTFLSNRPRLLAWTGAIVSERASRSVALLLISLATLGLLGYLANIAWLVQPLSAFPPLPMGSVIGLLVLGVGILTSSAQRLRWLSALCGVVALVSGAMRIVQTDRVTWFGALLARVQTPTQVNWHGLLSSQMALSSAVYIMLGALGLLAILARPRGLWSSITLAACGGIVMLLASTVVAAQLMGFLEGVNSGPFLGSSLQSSLCAIVFATHYNALVWTKQSGFSAPPAWLPLSVGAGSLITVLFVWRALIGSEEAHLTVQSQLAALGTRAAVTRQLMVAQRNLRRMARHSRAPDSTWQSSVTQMTEDVAGLESVIWADASGHPLGADRNVSADALSRVERTLKPYVSDFTSERQWAAFIAIDGDPSRSLMVQPRCRVGACTDLFVGVINARDVLGAIVADTVLGFDMSIGNATTWLRSSAPATEQGRRYMVTRPIVRGGPDWRIAVWPSARLVASTPSALSDIVLLLGIAVSVLLAIALRLAQTVAQSARLEERAKLDLALQSTTDGIWEWDIPTGAVTRSPQLWSTLGYGAGAAFSRMDHWLDLVHPDDRPGVESKLGDHLARRTESYDAQYRVRSAAGRWHNFVDRGRVVLRASDGTALHLMGMFADVTDRRHAEESLRQAETMSTMGRLAGRIAHEINNPLAGIQNAFMLVKDAIPSTHPHYKYVGAIEREVQRISQVTRQLYETYRPETESSTHAPVQTVVGDAVAFLEQVNRNTGVEVSVELGGIAAVVRLSDSMLRQCVYNLVQNAIEASPTGSRVVVRGMIEGGDFVLRVSDRGPGVPTAMRERIFEPFISTKPSQLSTGGMGMGLSLVRRAVDAAGGNIEVFDAEGGGAEFVVRIPLVEASLNGVTA
jgi:PAS domain S-box-containing protein